MVRNKLHRGCNIYRADLNSTKMTNRPHNSNTERLQYMKIMKIPQFGTYFYLITLACTSRRGSVFYFDYSISSLVPVGNPVM